MSETTDLTAAVSSLTLIMTNIQKTGGFGGGAAGAGRAGAAAAYRPSLFTGGGSTVEVTRKQQIAFDNFANSMRDSSIVIKNFRTTLKTLQSDVGLASTAFGTMLASATTFRELNRVVDRSKNAFEKSNSTILQNTATQIKTTDDIDAAQERLDKLKPLQRVLQDSEISIADSIKAIKNAGFGPELKSMAQQTKDINKALNMFEMDISKAGKDLGKFAAKAAATPGGPAGGPTGVLGGASGFMSALKLSPWGIALAAIGGAAIKAVIEMKGMTEAAIRFGTTVSLTSSIIAGLKPEELSEAYAKNSRTVNMLGGRFKGLDILIEKGQVLFENDVATRTEATQMTLGLTQVLQEMGGTVSDVDGFLSDQKGLYDEANRVLGYTTEQFLALTSALQKDSKTTKIMLGLKREERFEHLAALQQWQISLEKIGASSDTASKAIDSIRGISELSVADLTNQAVRAAAVARFVGVDTNAQEMLELTRRSHADDKEGMENLQKTYMLTGQAEAKMLQTLADQGKFMERTIVSEFFKNVGGPAEEQIAAQREIALETERVRNMDATERLAHERQLQAKAEEKRLGQLGTALKPAGVTEGNLRNLKLLQGIEAGMQHGVAIQLLAYGHMLGENGISGSIKKLRAEGMNTDGLAASIAGSLKDQQTVLQEELRELQDAADAEDKRYSKAAGENKSWQDNAPAVLQNFIEGVIQKNEEIHQQNMAGNAERQQELVNELKGLKVELAYQTEQKKAEQAAAKRIEDLQKKVADNTGEINDRQKEQGRMGSSYSTNSRSCTVGAI